MDEWAIETVTYVSVSAQIKKGRKQYEISQQNRT
jgi:hypothetical protein